jgi:hypothetical protein
MTGVTGKGGLVTRLVAVAAAALSAVALISPAPSVAHTVHAGSSHGDRHGDHHAHQPAPPVQPSACAGSDCLLPFPNDADTVADRSSATGRRVHFAADALPANVLGRHIDPTEWNRQDGFSPGEPILVSVPALDTRVSKVPDDTDIGASLRRDAPIVLLDTRTGRRTPYWAELDAHATAEPSRQLLIIRPAVALREATTYAVILRGLRDASGHRLSAPAPSERYVTATGPNRMGDTLRRAGVKQRDLYAAWTFTVASERSLTGRALAMRDQAFRQLGKKAPSFTVTSVTAGDARIARRVTGSISVPSFLTGDGGPGARLHYGSDRADALPTPTGSTYTAGFVCNLPVSATAERPATLSLYGHGLLGSPTEINAGNVEQMAAEQGFAFCATSWIGLASADVPFAAQTFTDLSAFPSLPDRLQQSFLNFLFLGRAMGHRHGFAADSAFQDAEGRPLIDVKGGLHYDGNSQGGINGGALAALAQDYTRAVLGVPGMNYSTLLQRSVDFAPFQQIMDGYYPDPVDQQLIFGLIQMLWDRGEANGYAQHLTRHPLPGTPTKTVLMHVAFGDHQVANVASEVEARTIGAAVRRPVVDPGWSTAKVPFWGVAPIRRFPYRGSAVVVWNSGATPAPPDTNLAPSAGVDPHSFPRSQPAAQRQKAVFLRTGFVVDTCEGACP